MVKLSFKLKGKNYNFEGNQVRDVFGEIIDWLVSLGYEFTGEIHESPTKKLLNRQEYEEVLRRSTYAPRNFHKVKNQDRWIISNYNSHLIERFLKSILVKIGAENIISNGFEFTRTNVEKIKKFDELSKETEPSTNNEITKSNPFRQAICVLGSPSAGKSTTVRKVLRNENHKFDIWEPTAVTTNLLAQFDSQEGYVPSRLGELLIEANENPGRCYTMVLDEFHKSNIIEMVNDELKHAISLKRYEGDRFISIDRPFRYLKEHLEVDDAGNVKVPDNFGFIFISSKPNVIANNRDIWDRLDIVNLTVENREGVSTADDLKKLIVSEAEKLKMVSQRND